MPGFSCSGDWIFGRPLQTGRTNVPQLKTLKDSRLCVPEFLTYFHLFRLSAPFCSCQPRHTFLRLRVVAIGTSAGVLGKWGRLQRLHLVRPAHTEHTAQAWAFRICCWLTWSWSRRRRAARKRKHKGTNAMKVQDGARRGPRKQPR